MVIIDDIATIDIGVTGLAIVFFGIAVGGCLVVVNHTSVGRLMAWGPRHIHAFCIGRCRKSE